MTPEEEAERVHDVLSGVCVLKCEYCNEAIPWKSQMGPPYYNGAPDGPFWAFAHEAFAGSDRLSTGYPDCINLSNEVLPARWGELWDLRTPSNEVFLKPSEEQLARARRVTGGLK